MFSFVLFITAFSSPGFSREMNEHLRLLEPLTHKNWEGEMPRFDK